MTAKGRVTPRNSTRYLSVPEICDDLDISRSTFYDWRAKGTGPTCFRLPNGSLRIRRVEYERWLTTLEDKAN